ncbi:SusD/RagB family nutrient-binding outer membrane lipoprotein [Hymenobacter ginsengisoli]|uniref:SusD/RagB family nutrient-binding outer membrane lipoprotein n=1 Tax=Hymenobacter ginsengisoli TaxID=1051626 RepID=A0ABP8QCM7_9BACT|nr:MULTISPECIES: SusD/RagB family nutrient-binding outer membrane lipoprotein [unclassified Hymenobacter]MBO2031396.1 SusD/RagB family nutrient-binding outer membrane lipoprotein [Hymenobacter sp. BT559]
MKKLIPFIALAAVLGGSSCSEKYLDQINTNPNAASANNLDPNYLLTDGELTFANTGYGQLLYPSTSIQGLASTFNYYGNGDKYVNAGGFTGYQALVFNQGYTALSRLQQAISVANTQSATRYANVIAISNIMKVMIFQRITDTYGDVPFTQAVQAAAGIVTPQYDKQQDIYPALLTQLDAAIASLNTTGVKASGDLLYGGDITQWKKLGYSLMVRVAMRMTKVNPALAKTYTEKAAAGGTMTGTADNAIVKTDIAFGDTQNATTNALLTTDDFREVKWSKTLIDYLRTSNDPRLGAIAEIPQPGAGNNANQALPGDNTPSLQRGLPNGYDQTGGANDIHKRADYPGPTGSGNDVAPLGNYSRPRVQVYIQRNAPIYLLTYAETEFLLAEAATRGWSVGATAATHYANGLRSALESLGQFNTNATVAPADIATFVAANPLSTANALQQINEQYWVETCTTFNFLEAWFNWRRSGYPVLTPVNYPGNVTNGTIPRRMIYPATEIGNNPAGYAAGVAGLAGGDLLTSRVWWDK